MGFDSLELLGLGVFLFVGGLCLLKRYSCTQVFNLALHVAEPRVIFSPGNNHGPCRLTKESDLGIGRQNSFQTLSI